MNVTGQSHHPTETQMIGFFESSCLLGYMTAPEENCEKFVNNPSLGLYLELFQNPPRPI